LLVTFPDNRSFGMGLPTRVSALQSSAYIESARRSAYPAKA